MDIPPMLWQFGGSLIAILVVAGLVAAMRLGGKPALKSESDVAQAADQVEDGFETARTSISRGGDAALARDPNGRIIVIKRHGNKFAGRILSSNAQTREEVDGLVVDPGESRFGSIRLSLKDASYWADAINRL
jgi:hypothetical protein